MVWSQRYSLQFMQMLFQKPLHCCQLENTVHGDVFETAVLRHLKPILGLATFVQVVNLSNWLEINLFIPTESD